jgi:hypothetical protein
MSNQMESEESHLSDVTDGCGCTEVWEHMSARRRDQEESTESD